MAKSADAFRTISEVAEWLGSPAHVLRFWESKFSQVKPVKRAGGRRYYRPSDMLLIGGIKKLLHDDGMTIKGVQKILRDQGVKYVASLSQPLEFDEADVVDSTLADDTAPADGTRDAAPSSAEAGNVVPFLRDDPADAEAPADAAPDTAAPAPASDDAAARPGSDDEEAPEAPLEESRPPASPDLEQAEAAQDDAADMADTGGMDAATDEGPGESIGAEEPEQPPDAGHDDIIAGPDAADEPTAAQDIPAPDAVEKSESKPELPAFLHRAAPKPAAEPEAEPEPAKPRPARIDLPPDPQDADVVASPGVLSTLAARQDKPDPAILAELAALRDRLAQLRAGNGQGPAG